MKKDSGAEGFFDDGLTYVFRDLKTGELNEVRPRHIHFEVKTDTEEDMETCNFRLYTVEKVAVPVEDAKPEAPNTTRRLQDEQLNDADMTFSSNRKPVTAAPKGPNKDYKKVEFSDTAFFRFGYFNYMKLNTQNML